MSEEQAVGLWQKITNVLTRAGLTSQIERELLARDQQDIEECQADDSDDEPPPLLPPVQVVVPEFAIPSFKNMPEDSLFEIVKEGQLFAPDDFEYNYLYLPTQFKSKFGYEPVHMMINDMPEIVAFRITKKYSKYDNKDYQDLIVE